MSFQVIFLGIIIFLQCYILLCKDCRKVYADTYWQKISDGVLVDSAEVSFKESLERNSLYLGVGNKLYTSQNHGVSWKQSKRFSDDIVDIISEADKLFIVLKDRVYLKSKSKYSFKQVFKIKNDIIYKAVFNNGKVFLGTSNGLYFFDSALKTKTESKWTKINSTKNFEIYDIVFAKDDIVIGTNKGVFKSKDYCISWENILIDNIACVEQLSEESREESNDEEENPAEILIKRLLYADGSLYILTHNNLFISGTGNTKNFISIGLPLRKTNDIIFDFDKILLAFTQKGIFQFDKKEKIWKKTYKGLGENLFYTGFKTQNNSLFVISDKYLYLKKDISLDVFNDCSLNKIDNLFCHEPDIRTVQKQAILYAEVHKEKVDDWVKRARSRAVMPDLSFSFKQKFDDTYEIATSTSKYLAYSVNGPEDETAEWNISLSWDLADLVFNSSETSIDVRSRLMVQLREDILDEVNRLYFERRRQQIELVFNEPDTEKEKLNKFLYIKELTAGLDAYTGGWFSHQINSKKNLRGVAQSG